MRSVMCLFIGFVNTFPHRSDVTNNTGKDFQAVG